MPSSKKKDVTVRVRMTKSQQKNLEAKASRDGMTLSAWLRALALQTEHVAIGSRKGTS